MASASRVCTTPVQLPLGPVTDRRVGRQGETGGTGLSWQRWWAVWAMGCMLLARYESLYSVTMASLPLLILPEQRYIAPLIAPPTPPQLEQDKQNIDEQFSRAFDLIDQLSTDTAALKAAEDARTERLDSALKDVENLVSDLKNASRRRDDETRRISDEIKSLKDAIPKALEGAREGNENRLKELGSELKSLKVLLGNRLGGSGAAPAVGRTLNSSTIPNAATPQPAPEPTPAATPSTNGLQATVTPAEQETQPVAVPSPAPAADSPLAKLGRSASIPAWQMAASNRAKTSSQSSPAPAGDKPAGSSSEQSAPPS